MADRDVVGGGIARIESGLAAAARRLGRVRAARERRRGSPEAVRGGYAAAYEPDLLPPPERMLDEGIEVLEEWFRWGEEWAVLLRVHAGLGADSDVLEIGCGQGRIAYCLRIVLFGEGSYRGFDINRGKIEALQSRFTPAHPRFRFHYADIHNTHYNPGGTVTPERYEFPFPDESFDVVFAASIFTHMGPATTARYVAETARVLRPGGRALFSFFLLDGYLAGRPRPQGFARPDFDFDHVHPGWDEGVGIAFSDDPERMTAYRVSLIERMAADAGLELAGPPIDGLWSGAHRRWAGAQDLVVLRRPEA
ncbi:MAG: hypothetical protein QOD86_1237 [Miltoncostaeaceae bacterium]|jgi:SAM-dependent methyltransferase|nr:hypothetical protein [Miltoncostaeaceae bacterium]